MVNLKVTFLGTSAAMPSENRSLSSIIINRNGTLFIFDVGEGMQYNFIKARFSFNKKTLIFITHMHSDHILGLLGLFQTLSLQGRTLPIDIYGPKLLSDFLKINLELLKVGLSFKLNIYSIPVDDYEGILVDNNEYKVTFCRSNHGENICSYAYCIIENDRCGKFNIEKAKEIGIPPGTLYTDLQKGNAIMFNGKWVDPSIIVGPRRPGRKIGISGDTRPTEKLISFFSDCDLLIFESTFAFSEIEKAKESFHSTAYEAAKLAKISCVHKLCLTHFSSRYKDLSILLKEALRVYSNVELAFDLKSISVDYR